MIQPGQQGSTGFSCPTGMQFISGSCQTADASLNDVTLQQAGANFKGLDFSYFCVFKNNEAIQVAIKATVLCLKPAM
jgi:hypothetical protein